MDPSLLSSDSSSSSNELVIDVTNYGASGTDQNNNNHNTSDQSTPEHLIRFSKLNFGVESILRVGHDDGGAGVDAKLINSMQSDHSKRSNSGSSLALSPSSTSSSAASSLTNSPADSNGGSGFQCTTTATNNNNRQSASAIGSRQSTQPPPAVPLAIFDVPLASTTATSESHLLSAPSSGRTAAVNGSQHQSSSPMSTFYQAYYASLGHHQSINSAGHWPVYDSLGLGLHKSTTPASSMSFFASSLDANPYEPTKTQVPPLPPIETCLSSAYLNCYTNPYTSMYPYSHLVSAYMNHNGTANNKLVNNNGFSSHTSQSAKEHPKSAAAHHQPSSTSSSSSSADKKKRSWSRAVFSTKQRIGLEHRFQVQKYITKPDRRHLANELGLTDAQVKVWFQNRRMKWRHSVEYQKELPLINALHHQELQTLMQKSALVGGGAEKKGGGKGSARTSTTGATSGQSTIAAVSVINSAAASSPSVIVRAKAMTDGGGGHIKLNNGNKMAADLLVK